MFSGAEEICPEAAESEDDAPLSNLISPSEKESNESPSSSSEDAEDDAEDLDPRERAEMRRQRAALAKVKKTAKQRRQDLKKAKDQVREVKRAMRAKGKSALENFRKWRHNNQDAEITVAWAASSKLGTDIDRALAQAQVFELYLSKHTRTTVTATHTMRKSEKRDRHQHPLVPGALRRLEHGSQERGD